jgi:hypothetical protein
MKRHPAKKKKMAAMPAQKALRRCRRRGDMRG